MTCYVSIIEKDLLGPQYRKHEAESGDGQKVLDKGQIMIPNNLPQSLFLLTLEREEL